MKSSSAVSITARQRKQIDELLRARLLPHGIARRLSALLLLSEGASLRSARAQTGLQLRHIVKWRERFAAMGVEGFGGSAPPLTAQPRERGPARTHPWRYRAQETSWGKKSLDQPLDGTAPPSEL